VHPQRIVPGGVAREVRSWEKQKAKLETALRRARD
jgi:hypothetical protein